MTDFTFYTLHDPAEPQHIRYVGHSVNPRKRLISHVSRAQPNSSYIKRRSAYTLWLRELIAAGRRPLMVTIEVKACASEAEADTIEQRYIDLYLEEGLDLVNTKGNPNRRRKR